MPNYVKAATDAIKKKVKPYADAAGQLGQVAKFAKEGGEIHRERGAGVNRTTTYVGAAAKARKR